MELEEAIENLKKQLENTKKASECGLATKGEFKGDIQAIETVLQALEDSVSKDIIRQKINERQFELQQEYKDFKDDIKLNTLQEIYYYEED